MFAVSSLTVSSQTCPSDHFSAVFVATADQVLDTPIAIVPDPDLTFFKNVLKFRDGDISHATEDALLFFNETYGLDFSTSLPPNDQHELFFENAKLFPYFISKEIRLTVTSNNWIRTGSTCSSCYTMSEGGFQVSFLGDQTLYGSYGGPEGKPVGIGNGLGYGFYSIDACQQSPIILQFQSATPIRAEPIDEISVTNQHVYNPVLGPGKAVTIFYFHASIYIPGKFLISIHVLFIFPA